MSDSIVVNYLRTRASDGRTYGVPYDTGVGPARIRMLTVEEKKEQEEAWEKREHKLTVLAFTERVCMMHNCSFGDVVDDAERFIKEATAWVNKEEE